METVVLSIHLILALLLIGVVLLQRSEGGGLGMGGGGGGVMTGRQAANALSKMTWILAAGFLVTSVTLTILAANKAEEGSVVDRVTETAPVEAPVATPAPVANDAPVTPPAADAPVTPPAAN
ncbi:preprotein translocase subunit SecG [Pseudothioclava arenosa]|uniref:Protein-export membrane protein SecG n=1 Tax=Pseudothioclava arenosa TaxID=1795308 RepID=A0A2A4CTD4_9RHOB|nr:preprotein translocase subunit SecG [Pseudothioclava arenosa]PCD77522.1 preprotein translocase subunit SecG [Pseudothioclava arenosa]